MARFRPRCPPGREAELQALIGDVCERAGNVGVETLAATVAARGTEWLAPGAAWMDGVPLDVAAGAIALSRPELAWSEMDVLAAVAPPELLDGPTPRWSPRPLERAIVIDWWRRWL